MELFTFGCEVAQAIGNPYMIVVPTMGPDMDRKTEQEVFEDSVRVLNQLADIAEPYGVRCALEIVQAVDRASVGLTVDCINFYMHDKCADLEYIAQIPQDKLFVYHINDCEDLPLRVLDHCHRIMPGEGCIPVAAISKKVMEVGYHGPACLELFRPAYWEMDAEDVICIGAKKCTAFLHH